MGRRDSRAQKCGCSVAGSYISVDAEMGLEGGASGFWGFIAKGLSFKAQSLQCYIAIMYGNEWIIQRDVNFYLSEFISYELNFLSDELGKVFKH